MRWLEPVVTLSALPIFQPAQQEWLKQHVYAAPPMDHADLGFVVRGDIAILLAARARSNSELPVKGPGDVSAPKPKSRTKNCLGSVRSAQRDCFRTPLFVYGACSFLALTAATFPKNCLCCPDGLKILPVVHKMPSSDPHSTGRGCDRSNGG